MKKFRDSFEHYCKSGVEPSAVGGRPPAGEKKNYPRLGKKARGKERYSTKGMRGNPPIKGKNPLQAYGSRYYSGPPTLKYCNFAKAAEQQNGDPSRCRPTKCYGPDYYSTLVQPCKDQYGVKLNYRSMCEFAQDKDECDNIKRCDCRWGMSWGQVFLVLIFIFLTFVLIFVLVANAGDKKKKPKRSRRTASSSRKTKSARF